MSCSVCGNLVTLGDQRGSLVKEGGISYHYQCFRETFHREPRVESGEDVCPYCNKVVSDTDQKTIVLGVTVHESCHRKRQASKNVDEHIKLKEASVCSVCAKEVTENQERIFVRGVEQHRECYLRTQAREEEKEHVKAQDRNELPVCSLCNREVKPTDNVAYVRGVPQHSECRARQHAQEEVKKVADVSVCAHCDKEIEGSQKNIVGGKEYHLACWGRSSRRVEDDKEHIKAQDRNELPVCNLCNREVKPTDNVAYVRGVPQHSECRARQNAQEEVKRAVDVSVCAICAKEIEGSQKNIVAGKEYHIACWQRSQEKEEKEHVRAQDRGELPVCNLCNREVKPTDNVAYVRGVPQHSECRARQNAQEEVKRAVDVSVCSICAKEIEGSQKNIIGGKEYHIACWQKSQEKEEKAHVRAQDRGELPVCNLCNREVKPTDNVAYVRGVPQHSECRARQNATEEVRKAADVSVCAICAKEIEGSQKNIIGGKEYHIACWQKSQEKQEKEHVRAQDRGELPVCNICNKEVKHTDSVAYVRGVPQHSECRARQNAAPEVKRAVDASVCSICAKEIEGSQKNIIGGKEYHIACWQKSQEKEEKTHVRAQDRGDLPVCNICNKEVKPTENVAYVRGVPQHSECRARQNAAPEVKRAVDVSVCGICSKEIEGSQKNIIGGKEYHIACWQKSQEKQEKEHVRAQDRGELPICSICKKDVKHTDSVAYVGGVPQHSECRARLTAAPEVKRAVDVPVCAICNKEVEGSQKNIIGGREYHLACWQKSQEKEEKAHVKAQDRDQEICQACKKPIELRSEAKYISGRAWCRTCYEEFKAQ